MDRTSTIDTLQDALGACGVTDTTLGADEIADLEGSGFVVFPCVLDDKQITRLRGLFEAAAVTGQGKQGGTRHVEVLVHHDPAYDEVLTHPKVLAAVHHVLRRPFGVLFLSGRDPLKDHGQQGLHTDWRPRGPRDPFSVVTALWLLDDFTDTNGPTRLLPGSHATPLRLPKSQQAPAARHPDEHRVTAPAGSVLVFNGHVWHSGTRNNSGALRRVLQCAFVARGLDLGLNRAGNPPTPDLTTWSPAARWLLA